MRDLETIEAAVTAAETGHIVFGTLHTTGAQGTVDRIIDVFPTTQQDQIRTQLSTAIIAVLSQALLPRKPKGLVAAYELLAVTPAIANLIREGKTYRINSSIQTGKKFGMQLLDDGLFNLWKSGTCDEEEVLLRANNRDELALKIQRAKKGVFDDEEQGAEGPEEDARPVRPTTQRPAQPAARPATPPAPARPLPSKPATTPATKEDDLDTLRAIARQLGQGDK
jgi:twitching motility protein PilT